MAIANFKKELLESAKIVYDITVLGRGFHEHKARTGVFRVVENLACGLYGFKDIDIEFICTNSSQSLFYCLDYLHSNDSLLRSNLPCPISSKASYRIYKAIQKSEGILDLMPSGSQGRISSCLKHFKDFLFRSLDQHPSQYIGFQRLSKADIFHTPYYPLPPLIKDNKKIKKFLTIYDLIPVFFPEFYCFDSNHILHRILDSITPDSFILSISQSTKNDLCNYRSDIDPDRVFVTHLAASNKFYPCQDLKRIMAVKKKYRIPFDGKYLLSVSTLEPRKNIPHIMRCFAEFVSQERIQDLYLVLVGTSGWDYNTIFDEIAKYSDLSKIILTGFVDDEDLPLLYSGALAFLYLSIYEGFGLPVLEAIQCGIPVISSNTSSLPEVLGNTGLMVPPDDSDALCHEIYRIYSSPALRDSMKNDSIRQASKFTWEKCIQKTVDSYIYALNS